MSEYDRRAEAWVRAKYPDAKPDPGSVEFTNDCAAYASGGWSTVDVSWTEGGQPKGHPLSESAWQYDWTQIIRELLETEPEPVAVPANAPIDYRVRRPDGTLLYRLYMAAEMDTGQPWISPDEDSIWVSYEDPIRPPWILERCEAGQDWVTIDQRPA